MPTNREFMVMLLQANGWSEDDAIGFCDLLADEIQDAKTKN